MTAEVQMVLDLYPQVNKPKIQHLLCYLISLTEVQGIYIAGAISFDRIDTLSDVDVHCVVKDSLGPKFRKSLDRFIQNNGMAYCTKPKHYPWFGEMRSIYVFDTKLFYFDIGFIEEKQMNHFYFQYKGIIIKDASEKLLQRVQRCSSQEADKVSELSEFYLDQLFTAAVKIRKDLLRGLYWNSVENLSQLRRAFVFMISYTYYYEQKFPFIGRPERDIEKVWNDNHLATLKRSIPDHTLDSVYQSAIYILEESLCLKKVNSRPALVAALKHILKLFVEDLEYACVLDN